MNRNKTLLLIIGFLLLVNIVLIYMFLQKKDGPGPRQDKKAYISAFLKNNIGFTKQQLDSYDTMSDNHRKRMSAVFDKQRQTRSQQFNKLVAGNFSDSIINALADSSCAMQKTAEVMMLNHMKSIRMLCTPQQQPVFDTSFGKALAQRNESRRRPAPAQ